MEDFYRKAYAYLVGEIDEALSVLDTVRPGDGADSGRKLLRVRQRLQAALYRVEERYMEEDPG